MNTQPTTNSRGKPQPQMPANSANLAPPAPRNTQDQVWADEAARAAQRHFDMAAEIARLTGELEDWRRRALGAEGDLKRAAEREGHLQQQIEAKTEQLTSERDVFRECVIKISTQFGTASQIILDAHKLMDEALGRKPQVNMASLAEQIDKDMAAEEPPIPAVVRAGPRID